MAGHKYKPPPAEIPRSLCIPLQGTMCFSKKEVALNLKTEIDIEYGKIRVDKLPAP
jgi:hypothetical protein